jgi:ABC-type uncharacterized transport system permease subunit
MTKSTRRKLVEVAFTVAVCVIAGVGFTYKMSEFAMTIAKDEVEGFGAVAIGTYLIGMVPMVFLMLWAILTGRFRDLEATKRRLFELDEEIERGEIHA